MFRLFWFPWLSHRSEDEMGWNEMKLNSLHWWRAFCWRAFCWRATESTTNLDSTQTGFSLMMSWIHLVHTWFTRKKIHESCSNVLQFENYRSSIHWVKRIVTYAQINWTIQNVYNAIPLTQCSSVSLYFYG